MIPKRTLGQKRNRLFFPLCAAVILAVLVGGLTAQTIENKKSDLQRGLDQARRLEQVGRYEDALAIHLRLFQTTPDNTHVLNGVERDLLQLERYEELVRFLRDRLAEKPDDALLLGKLGNALYISGQQEEGERTWDRLIELMPGERASYTTVARHYLYNGVYDKTVETYLRGRKYLGEPALFSRELANLYTSRMMFGQATDEYLRLLKENEKQFSFVESMLGRFELDDDRGQDVITVLRKAVEATPDNPMLRRLLGAQYLRQAMPEDAFEQYLKVEAIEGTGGATLLEFGEWAFRERFYTTALQSYRQLIEEYPDSPLLPKAHQGIGQSLTGLGRLEEAIAAYRVLAAGYPKSKEAAFALFQIGKIQLRDLVQPDSALVAFGQLVRNGRGSHYFDAMFLIGECHLMKNDLVGAERQYEKAGKEAAKAPPVAEEAAFRIAEMKYFRGDFDGALKDLELAIGTYPRGMFTNDAIALLVFIEENRMLGDDALKAFTAGALLERQKKLEEAVAAYERIGIYYPHSFLVDDALLHIGAIQTEQGQYTTAIETYRDLLEKQPDCEQCDEVQRRIGEVYETDLNDLPAAIEEYGKVLSKYPDSLLFDTVRKRIRQLQIQAGETG